MGFGPSIASVAATLAQASVELGADCDYSQMLLYRANMSLQLPAGWNWCPLDNHDCPHVTCLNTFNWKAQSSRAMILCQHVQFDDWLL
jgi:hypothetical protein